jgi:hypothetical protein
MMARTSPRDMKENKPNGVFRLLGGQLNSTTTARTRDRRITDLDRIIKNGTYKVEGSRRWE